MIATSRRTGRQVGTRSRLREVFLVVSFALLSVASISARAQTSARPGEIGFALVMAPKIYAEQRGIEEIEAMAKNFPVALKRGSPKEIDKYLHDYMQFLRSCSKDMKDIERVLTDACTRVNSAYMPDQKTCGEFSSFVRNGRAKMARSNNLMCSSLAKAFNKPEAVKSCLQNFQQNM